MLALAGCGGGGEDVSRAATGAPGDIVATASAPAPPATAGDAASGRVREVIDAETLVVVAGGEAAHVRVIGIDAPALALPDGRPACGALAARDAVVRLALGRPVRLVVGLEPADAAGRVLARVDLLDGPGAGSDLATALVREGRVRVRLRPPNTAQRAALLGLEEQARARRAGLWGACGVERAFPRDSGA